MTSPNICFFHQSVVDIPESLFRQLNDKNLTVIRATLSIDGMPNVSELFDALQNVLTRCVEKMLSSKHGVYIKLHLSSSFIFSYLMLSY